MLPLKINLTINGKLGDLFLVSVIISKSSYPIHDWAKCRPLGRVLIPALLHKIIPTRKKNTTLHRIRRVEITILLNTTQKDTFLYYIFFKMMPPKKCCSNMRWTCKFPIPGESLHVKETIDSYESQIQSTRVKRTGLRTQQQHFNKEDWRQRKTHQMFSVPATTEEFRNATITGHFLFFVWRKLG